MSFKTSIYGKYFLLDRIAVGGMAEVFKAKTFGVHGFERLLVIKRILPHLTEDEEFIEMFIDEAKIAVELTHANICQVSDLGRIGSNYFIAMEFINGKDLRAVLKKCYTAKTSLSIPQALYIALEILKGLDYAHHKVDSISGNPLNLIHRDISPQNIMLSYYGQVKIVDFGIAKTESKLHRTQAGVLKGKFGYMSPEQAAGMPIDQRTDLFSTGIILFEMLTSRRLFHAETDFKTLEAIKTCNVPSPKKYNSDITDELEKIILKTLAKDPENRYSTGQEIQKDISKIFYTQYADFNPKDLSDFLNDLFKTEIIEEQEALRRAEDAISPQQKKSVTSASIHEHSASLKGENVNSQPSISTKTSNKIYSDNPLSALKEILKNKLVIGGLAGFILLFGIIKLFTGSDEEKPKQTQEDASQAQLVTINSTPPGATVIVEKEALGVTPVSLRLIPNKVYEIQLKLSGFKDFLDPGVFVRPDQESLNFSLEKIEAPLGDLFVDSIPQGAKIFNNDQDTGLVTPATLRKLELKKGYDITVQLEGFESQSKKVKLEKDLDDVMFSLKSAPASIQINIIPKNALILLDGKKTTSTIKDLEQGKTYTLRFKAKGYRSKTQKITPSRQHTDIDVELKRKAVPKGMISLQAIPWATIIIDGKRIGDTPKTDYTLSVGKHTIIFRHPDYNDKKMTVNIKKGANKPIIVKFSK